MSFDRALLRLTATLLSAFGSFRQAGGPLGFLRSMGCPKLPADGYWETGAWLVPTQGRDFMADALFELSAARARLEAEIEALQVKQRHLDVVRGEFEHDGRRVRDALERVGGRSHELEQRMKSLARNEKLTETDLEQNAKALKRLERRLAEITAEIARAEGS